MKGFTWNIMLSLLDKQLHRTKHLYMSTFTHYAYSISILIQEQVNHNIVLIFVKKLNMYFCYVSDTNDFSITGYRIEYMM